MDDDKLRELLEELHQKIENTKSIDERGRELLDHLNADIRHLLERTEQEGQPRVTSREVNRLEESIQNANRQRSA